MDKKVVENKIEEMLILIGKLEEILVEHQKNNKLKEFLLYVAEKKTEEIVEQAVSINQELLRDNGKVSKSYYDSFLDLKKFKVFEEKDLIQLAGTAGFRNRLAHDYLDVDDDLALKTMKGIGSLYKLYLQKIRKILYLTKK